MVDIEIVNSRICEDDGESEKKYVSYTVTVKQGLNVVSSIERRYTDFNNLYNNLKKEHPTLMGGVNFPKKVVMGNFNPSMISSRCVGFQTFLETVVNDSRLRDSLHTVDFFQAKDLTIAKQLITQYKYDQAMIILENNFKLLNKLYTDRSHVVLITLCRLVACGIGGAGADIESNTALAGPVEKWAELSLRRFHGVSDTDLLTLYVPLIKSCISIWKVLGKDCEELQSDLDKMKKRGMKVDTCPELWKAIEQLEGI